MPRFWTTETLLQHLPALFRERDAEVAAASGGEEGPLRALLAAMAEEIGRVEDALDQLEESAFVETCPSWALPYLGALLDIPEFPPAGAEGFTGRAYVANVIAHRRRKGTPGMLEELARDATGCAARVVEYFLRLARTQHLNRLRPDEWLTADLRNLDALERLGTAFDEVHRLPDVRAMNSRRRQGRHNVPSLGVHLWPLRAYAPPGLGAVGPNPPARFAVEARPAAPPAAPGDRAARWFLHPSGETVRLLQRPLSPSGPEAAPPERAYPEPLRRLPLHRELESLRQALAEGDPPPALAWFDPAEAVVQFFTDDDAAPVPAQEIVIADFSAAWPAVPVSRSYPRRDGTLADLPVRLAFDPARGQVAFAPGREPAVLRAVWAYGGTADMGGGPYDRRATVLEAFAGSIDWQIGVSRLLPAEPAQAGPAGHSGGVVGTLAAAVQAWNALPEGVTGVICLLDGMAYQEDLTGAAAIRIPAASRLLVTAADWPRSETEPGVFERRVGDFSADRLWPSVRGSVEVVGTAADGESDPGLLAVDGLFLDGDLTVLPGRLGTLDLRHVTLPAGSGRSVRVQGGAGNRDLRLGIRWSQIGRVTAARPELESVEIADSLVGLPGNPAAPAVAVPGSLLRIDRTTVWGAAGCRELDASEVIFDAPVTAERRQAGCVRYSWVPLASQTPRRYRCQPDQAVRAAGAENDPAETVRLAAQLRPVFSSRDPREPAYGRLDLSCAAEIRAGGEQGREMGVFAAREFPARVGFLERSFDEYVRAGLHAGIVHELPLPPVSYAAP